MKVISLEAHNVMKIEDIRFDLEGEHLFLIGGKNGQGKTSSLKSLLIALCGKAAMDYPDIVLKNGEKRGSIKVELSGDEELHDDLGFTIELDFIRKPSGTVVEEFRVLDSTGDPAAEPRTLLKSLYSLRAFDPLEFERMKPKAQVDMLREMLGLDFTQADDDRKTAYEARTQVGRTGKRLRGELDAMPQYNGLSKEPTSILTLTMEMDQIKEGNKDHWEIQRSIDSVDDKLDHLLKNENDIKGEIAALKEKLAASKNERKTAGNSLAGLQKKLAGHPIKDDSEVMQKMKDLEANNLRIAANKAHENMQDSVDAKTEEYEALTATIKDIDEAKQKAIEDAEWPVTDMALDGNTLILSGMPFEQASAAQRIVASARIGMAMNPKLRLMVCEDGSRLDLDTLKVLGDLVEENDFQLLLEVVTRSESDEQLCSVVIRDGKISE